MSSPLDLFHPVTAAWFAERIGTPTDVQAAAWPEIAASRHVLATAPTGSGKTLTAFLWALDRLFAGAWASGAVRVLYVSPLKALNADIEKNLERPLAELAARFAAAGLAVPGLRAAVRSGDTPAAERQRLVRNPPEILITTPESLNILLTARGGRAIFGQLETVILDEVHAVAGSKRGVHLATAVERLVRLSGEFQRVALSATVRPLERVAEWVGGWQLVGEDGYRRRPVALVRSQAVKRYEVKVAFPAEAALGQDGAELPGSSWDLLVPELARTIGRNRSTLLFTNGRRTTEKLTRLLNDHAGRDVVYSHHGSLSKEVRVVVEGRLKRGELPALVATSSLELGIDVGELDEVLLVQTPKSVASAIQRVGRSGHRVGQASRGTLYPLYGRDFLDAAVVARAILDQDIEAVRPVAGALDVLAQVLLSMLAAEEWQVDELYGFVRTCEPYHALPRRAFDLTLEMLAGRFADSRVRELAGRIALDRVTGRARARPGGAQLIYLSGGTIPDRGYFTLRLQGSMARLGELDEEFVWERSIGDTFTLGAQGWRIAQITHNDVLVTPARGGSAMAPFWRADEQDRGFHLSERIGQFLEWADAALERPSFEAELAAAYPLEPAAAAELKRILLEQRAASGGSLPHRHHLLCERIAQGRADGRVQLILHTFWGGTVNRPLTLALAAAWQAANPTAPLEWVLDDDCISFIVPESVGAEEMLALIDPENVERLLRGRLETTGFFGARFREAAGRALLLPRASFRQRTPLWLNRQRAKKLLEAVGPHDDFPLVLETWRTCLEDEFELERVKQVLGELAAGTIRLSEVRTASPSPFAANLVWKQTNTAMYDDDTPLGGGAVRTDLFQELLASPHLRPKLAPSLAAELEAKLQRLAPGYAPRDARELVEWVKERLVLGEGEWRALTQAFERDRAGEAPLAEALPQLAARLVRLTLPRAAGPVVVALETLPRLAQALGLARADLAVASLVVDDPLPSEAAAGLERLFARADSTTGGVELVPALLAEWARYQGPFELARPRELLGLATAIFEEAVAALVEDGAWIADAFFAGRDEVLLCDRDNLETLLRWTRAAARPSFEARPFAELPLFLATFQGLTPSGRAATVEDLKRRLEQLLGYPAPATLWEQQILPARLDPYYTAWLDALFAETELAWWGVGNEKIAFAFPGDLELLGVGGPKTVPPDLAALFADPGGRYELGELARRHGLDTRELAERLWQAAWQGEAVNDGFLALRRAAQQGFKILTEGEPPRAAEPARRGRFERWQGSRPFTGRWRLVPPVAAPEDALAGEELAKERVRLVLGRYGVLFRELLARELPALQWGQLFRALRLMELSGEVVAGYFFQGIPGPQFASTAAFRLLREGLVEDAIYWLSAADPASLAGVDLPELKGTLPRRLANHHLVYHGTRKVIESRRSAAELDIAVDPDHPELPAYLGFLKVQLTRDFAPETGLKIERINGEPSHQSPYQAVLREHFGSSRDYGTLRLFRRW